MLLCLEGDAFILNDLIVINDFRQKGIGKQLMKKAFHLQTKYALSETDQQTTMALYTEMIATK